MWAGGPGLVGLQVSHECSGLCAQRRWPHSSGRSVLPKDRGHHRDPPHLPSLSLYFRSFISCVKMLVLILKHPPNRLL